MKIVCAKCSAKIEYDKIETRIVYKDFADEMAKKCPAVIARGEQSGQASHWDCNVIADQIDSYP